MRDDAARQLAAINVEFNDIYSVYAASSELEAVLPAINAALKQALGDGSNARRAIKKAKPLPTPVCSIVGNVLGSYVYLHKRLDRMFYEGRAGGEVPAGSCVISARNSKQKVAKAFVTFLPNMALLITRAV